MKTLFTGLIGLLLCLPFGLFAQQAQFHLGLKIQATPQDGSSFKFSLANPPKLNAPTKNQPYLSYFWDFGDGTFKRGNVQEPVHSYAKAGTYTVRAMIFTGNTLDMVEQPPSIAVSGSVGYFVFMSFIFCHCSGVRQLPLPFKICLICPNSTLNSNDSFAFCACNESLSVFSTSFFLVV